MPPRPNWKGHLRVSLVSFGVRLYNGVSGSNEISFNQLHKKCLMRIKYDRVCPEHGKLDLSEIVKGYQYEKGKYVIVAESDLENIKLETTKILEIVQFIDPGELDDEYSSVPYYVAPDGPVSDPPFRVMREAMRKTGKWGIGRVVMNGRERIFNLRIEGKGFRLTTMRYPDEIRGAEPYFEEIQDEAADSSQVKLATQLIETLSSPLDLAQFKDRYQEELLNFIKSKIEGEEPQVVQEAEVAKTLNFMDALKKSLSAQKKPPAPHKEKRKAKGA